MEEEEEGVEGGGGRRWEVEFPEKTRKTIFSLHRFQCFVDFSIPAAWRELKSTKHWNLCSAKFVFRVLSENEGVVLGSYKC